MNTGANYKMPPMEKKRKTMRKQDWSIDEWLEASRVKYQKQQAKQARAITRDRKLRESAEIAQ